MIVLGSKIKELRQRDGRTQEELAGALGVSPQAVSRWETQICYPDMEIIPAIANYFHVSIDLLFGYDNDRAQRIATILETDEKMYKDGTKIDEHIDFLRRALTEFPSDWQIKHRLAVALLGLSTMMPASGDAALKEAARLCEEALKNCDNARGRYRITGTLVGAYEALRDGESIEKLADESSPVYRSREVILTRSPDPQKRKTYIGNAILVLLHEFSSALLNAYEHGGRATKTEDWLNALSALIGLYEAIFADGDYEIDHADAEMLCLRAAQTASHLGRTDEALAFIDDAFEHHTGLKEHLKTHASKRTSPLIAQSDDPFGQYPIPSADFFRGCVDCMSDDVAQRIRDNPKYRSVFE